MDELPPRPYTKILVARRSPTNGCAGPDSGWLVPAPPQESAGKAVGSHRFVAIRGRHGNKFGWVSQMATPLTAADLMNMDLAGMRGKCGDDAAITVPALAWYESYLHAVDRIGVDLAMGCDWREINLPGVQRRELWVHLVRFYPG